jgi:hypothetical protein
MLRGKFQGVINPTTPIGSRYRDRVAEELVHRAGVVPDHVHDHRQLPSRVRDRHADVVALEHRQLLGVLLDDVGESMHHPSTSDR